MPPSPAEKPRRRIGVLLGGLIVGGIVGPIEDISNGEAAHRTAHGIPGPGKRLRNESARHSHLALEQPGPWSVSSEVISLWLIRMTNSSYRL
jgi:hypothetical protein